MKRRSIRSDFEVLAKFRSGEWAVQPTLGEIYLPAERRMMKSQMNEDGYLQISIPPERSHYPLSRAVWIGSTMNVPEFEELEVDHINEIKTDNRFENLRLLTPAGNTSRSQSPLTFELAEEIRRRYAAGGISKTALAKEHNCSEKTIRNIISERTYAHKKVDAKTKLAYETLTRKTKEEIFYKFCVEGRKLAWILERFKITKEVLRCVIEEESLRTNTEIRGRGVKHDAAVNPGTAETRIKWEGTANTAEAHHYTNKGDLKP